MEKNNKSTYYGDKKIQKYRMISNGFLIAAIIMGGLLFFIWKDEYSELEIKGIESFFKMPIIMIIGIVLAFAISAIFHYLAAAKSIIKEIKSDDNPFLKK